MTSYWFSYDFVIYLSFFFSYTYICMYVCKYLQSMHMFARILYARLLWTMYKLYMATLRICFKCRRELQHVLHAQRETAKHTHTDRERERVYMKKCEFVCVCVFVSSSLQVGIPIVSLIIIMARAQNDMNCIYRYTTTFVTGTGHAPVLLQKYFHQNPFVLLRFLCNNNIKLVYLCIK